MGQEKGSFVSSVLLLQQWQPPVAARSLLAALLILYKAEFGNVLAQTMALGCVLALLHCGTCLVCTRGEGNTSPSPHSGLVGMIVQLPEVLVFVSI